MADKKADKIGKSHNGASVGIDFGLKTYMTLSDGKELQSPLYFKQALNDLRKSSRKFSRCVKGSNHRKRCKQSLERRYIAVTNKCRDFHWKLAHGLCRSYDYIFVEDLNIKGMTKLWGRKVSDMGFSDFVNILQYVATKYDVTIHKIDRYYPSSKTCECSYIYKGLTLRERKWCCPQCGAVNQRDLLAANNILRRGIYELESNSNTKRGLCLSGGCTTIQESHVL